ncbi:DUF4164 family protein [Algihabitans albus]|uniref:DUF4164 family protein n=1 Tax=Algihabitans albus TaxID=2164067 RepID=UPI0035D05806
MTDLDEANRRLEAALTRLDRAVATRLESDIRPDAAHGEVAAALAEAQQESKRLRQLSGDVSRRLDAAIARLDQVLEG